MSKAEQPDFEQKEDEVLEKLYELREDLKIVADSDAEYAKYAKEGLRVLEEAGYDV